MRSAKQRKRTKAREGSAEEACGGRTWKAGADGNATNEEEEEEEEEQSHGCWLSLRQRRSHLTCAFVAVAALLHASCVALVAQSSATHASGEASIQGRGGECSRRRRRQVAWSPAWRSSRVANMRGTATSVVKHTSGVTGGAVRSEHDKRADGERERRSCSECCRG